MDPASLIPTPEVIPLPAPWLQVMLLAVFLLHVVAMNLMLGGSLIALFHSLRAGAAPPSAPPLDQEISRHLPASIALTVNLGVPPYLFLQLLYGHFVYTSAVLMASWWLWLFLVAMAAYYAAYVYDFKFAALAGARVFFIGLTVVGLLAAGLLLTHNTTLMLKPALWATHLDRPDGHLMDWADPSLAPRFLHFVTGSLAVAGLGLALWGRWRTRRGQAPGAEMTRRGLGWFTGATLAQLAVGLWFLFSLPAAIMPRFIGGDLFATLALWGGVAVALLAILLARRQNPLGAGLAALLTLTLMVITRDQLRQAYLAPYFHIQSLTVTPQYGPALVFAVALVLGLGVLTWLLKAARQAGKDA